MEIKNPRRILALGASDSGVLSLLKDLTGTAPEPPSTNSTAGLTHALSLKTKYYTATIPIWIDEIVSLSAWSGDFTSPEAAEVVSAVGAWLLCFRKPTTSAEKAEIQDTIKAIAEVVRKGSGDGYGYGGWYKAMMVAVAMPARSTPWLEVARGEWEDVAVENGFVFIDSEEAGKNEFGERVGVEGIREALEACEWEGNSGFDGAMGGGDEEGWEGTFDAEEAEMGMELFGMKSALRDIGEDRDGRGFEDGDEERQVEELEEMMRKLQAVRDMGAELPEAERRRLAAKAVNDIMNSF